MQKKLYNGLPFEVTKLTDELEIRKFFAGVETEELKWHRDPEDRLFKKISGDGWLLQLDNEMPIPIRVHESHFIPAGIWHRVIKTPSATDLVIQLHKRCKK